MASTLTNLFVLSLVTLLVGAAHGQLSATFYSSSCPKLGGIVRSAMAQAVKKEPRMGASILRLFFHDCFVNGCDASVLLDDTSTFTGEKSAAPNKNSLRGFNVIDAIKSQVEAACKATVSCSDILALSARDAVVAAQCSFFRGHLYNDKNVDANFAALRKRSCPATGGDTTLAPLDVLRPVRFDNGYYRNLVAKKGLFHSDQQLFNNGSQDSLVRQYSLSASAFASDFAAAMVKMGSISPLTGNKGEVRLNCKRKN